MLLEGGAACLVEAAVGLLKREGGGRSSFSKLTEGGAARCISAHRVGPDGGGRERLPRGGDPAR